MSTIEISKNVLNSFEKNDVTYLLNNHDKNNFISKQNYFIEDIEDSQELNNILSGLKIENYANKWEIGSNYLESNPLTNKPNHLCSVDQMEQKRAKKEIYQILNRDKKRIKSCSSAGIKRTLNLKGNVLFDDTTKPIINDNYNSEPIHKSVPIRNINPLYKFTRQASGNLKYSNTN